MKPARQAGASTIEVLLVIAVIALLTMLTIPRYSSSTGYLSLDMAARQLAADLRWMQQTSINSIAGSQSASIPFDSHPTLRFITVAPYGYFISIRNVRVIQYEFPAGVHVYGVYPDISFGIHGYLNHRFGIEIPLLYDSQIKKVIVDVAGRVRIE